MTDLNTKMRRICNNLPKMVTTAYPGCCVDQVPENYDAEELHETSEAALLSHRTRISLLRGHTFR